MTVDLKTLSNLGQVLTAISADIEAERPSVAFLGYTDIMLNPGEMAELGVDPAALTNRPNFDNLRAIHNRPDVQIVPTLSSFLPALIKKPVDLTVFDFTQYEGSEVCHDLNFRTPEEYDGRFDLIVDYGTCEHIFNIAQALINVLTMLRTGGLVYHAGPLCWPNHGFYGYNPTLFADFYEDNGCEILDMILSATFVDNGQRRFLGVDGIPKYDRFRLAEAFQANPDLLKLEYNLSVVAQKERATEEVVYPIQRKYRDQSRWM
jgi:SAM-dependent methyltransferase